MTSNAECHCCAPPWDWKPFPCDKTTACPQCAAGMPKTWELTVAGVTNGTCSECDDFNGIFVVTHLVTCVAYSPFDGFPVDPNCSGLNGQWQLSVNTPDVRILGRGSFDVAEYKLPIGDWKCNGPNTLPLLANSGECGNWPATLTIEPLC